MKTRDTYADAASLAAVPSQYDLVQPKYDGHWCCAVAKAGKAEVFKRGASDPACEQPAGNDYIIVGEYLTGTPWAAAHARHGDIAAFDLLELRGRDLRSRPYWERHKMLCALLSDMKPTSIFPVESYPRSIAEHLWRSRVLAGERLEGLIFRESAAGFRTSAPVVRVKRLVSQEYWIVAAYEGQGKLAGCLASFGVALSPAGSEVCRVAAAAPEAELPWSHGVRRSLWSNWRRHPSMLRDRCFEATGFDLFPSGALRSAKFLRWREDKDRKQHQQQTQDTKMDKETIIAAVSEALKDWNLEIDVTEDVTKAVTAAVKPFEERLSAIEAAVKAGPARVDSIAAAASVARARKRAA